MLSQFCLRRDKREELSHLFLQLKDMPLCQYVDVQSKRVQPERPQEHQEQRYIRSYGDIGVYTDAKCYENENEYFERDAAGTNRLLPKIKLRIVKNENQKKERETKQLQHFKRQIYVWFYNESLIPRQTQPPPSKRTYMQPTITIKSDKKEGIQVQGTILTRDGYKITYPNVHNILKMSSLWKEESKLLVQRSFYNMKPDNHPDLYDSQYDELKGYVWKMKQYKNFFKNLLKISINNIEIKKVLVDVAIALGTSANHVHLFYQISSKPWAIPKMIKRLNSKKLMTKERREWLNQLLVNIKEELAEIFESEEQESFIPVEEQFISFDRYVVKLQDLDRKRFMINPKSHKRFLDFDAKLTDIKAIEMLGMEVTDAVECLLRAPFRPDSPFSKQALTNLGLTVEDLRQETNQDFEFAGEIHENTDMRYQLHLCQIAELKKALIKERNRLKKESIKGSMLESRTGHLPSSRHSLQLNFKNYYSNKLDDMQAHIKEQRAREANKLKSQFLSSLQLELLTKEKYDSLESMTSRAIKGREKVIEDRLVKVKSQNKHVDEVHTKQKARKERFYQEMEELKESLSSEEEKKYSIQNKCSQQMLLERRRLNEGIQAIKEEKHQNRQAEVQTKRIIFESQERAKAQQLLHRLDKHFETSLYLNRQCLTDRQKRSDRLLSRVELVRGRASELEREEQDHKINVLLRKEDVHQHVKSPASIDSKLKKKSREERFKKNMDHVIQQREQERIEILQRQEMKEQALWRNSEQQEQQRLDRLNASKSRFVMCLSRYETINQQYKKRCDHILEKERNDSDVIFGLTQRRDQFKDNIVLSATIEKNKQKEDLQRQLQRFRENPSKTQLIKSLSKYDMMDSQFVDRFFPKKPPIVN